MIPDSADEFLSYALDLAAKGVQTDDGHQYLVDARDLVNYAETIRALVADHKALRHMHNELRSVCNAHIAELEAEIDRVRAHPLVATVDMNASVVIDTDDYLAMSRPTDDEREALAEIAREAWAHYQVIQNDPEFGGDFEDVLAYRLALAGFRRQEPITDAMVVKALDAYYYPAPGGRAYSQKSIEQMRRALESLRSSNED